MWSAERNPGRRTHVFVARINLHRPHQCAKKSVAIRLLRTSPCVTEPVSPRRVLFCLRHETSLAHSPTRRVTKLIIFYSPDKHNQRLPRKRRFSLVERLSDTFGRRNHTRPFRHRLARLRTGERACRQSKPAPQRRETVVPVTGKDDRKWPVKVLQSLCNSSQTN
ncbi:hypothetical protein HOE425_40003 [Hoeflea sp. EC-HK425]|nr:hypothetical protein HOE425_40003 [Hoeflea sp. EC-HK425]